MKCSLATRWREECDRPGPSGVRPFPGSTLSLEAFLHTYGFMATYLALKIKVIIGQGQRSQCKRVCTTRVFYK